jgi:hypothetical protein
MQTNEQVDSVRLECVLWALVRGSQRAEARTRPHGRGIELYVTIDGEQHHAQAFSAADGPELETLEMEMRQAFILDGWQAAGPHR